MGYNPEYYKQNKEKYATKSKAWREANPEKAKLNRKKYYEAHKEQEMLYSTQYNHMKRIGCSPEHYNLLLQKQNGLCAICGSNCRRALAADHNHITGEIRGLLCNNCNRGLGHFKDNPELLYNAMKYLEKGIIPTKVTRESNWGSDWVDDGV